MDLNPNITALHDWHEEKASITTFANWKLPREFSSTKKEHLSVRNGVGLFDISHMGRIMVSGKKSTPFLEYVLSRNVKKMGKGESKYMLVCNERGGIKDDLVVFKLKEDRYFLVCNSATRQKVLAWLESLKNLILQTSGKTSDTELGIEIEDKTFSTSLFAVQGPKAEAIFQDMSAESIPDERFKFETTEIFGHKSILSRTGYTGEDGFEIIPMEIGNKDKEEALNLWTSILRIGERHGIKPCGLGARDTLRLEAGYPLYGNELDEDTNPLESKLEFAVNLDEDDDFIGKDSLLRRRKEKPERTRIGFEMEDRGIPRKGMVIESGEEMIGTVTSGTYSPVLEKGIGMGYVPPEYSESESTIQIKIRGREAKGKMVDLPFV